MSSSPTSTPLTTRPKPNHGGINMGEPSTSDAGLLPDEDRVSSDDQDTRYVGEFLVSALQNSIDRIGSTPLGAPALVLRRADRDHRDDHREDAHRSGSRRGGPVVGHPGRPGRPVPRRRLTATNIEAQRGDAPLSWSSAIIAARGQARPSCFAGSLATTDHRGAAHAPLPPPPLLARRSRTSPVRLGR